VSAHDHRPIRGARKRDPVVPGGVRFHDESELADLVLQPAACSGPHGSPGQTLRALGGGRQGGDLAQIGNHAARADAGGVDRLVLHGAQDYMSAGDASKPEIVFTRRRCYKRPSVIEEELWVRTPIPTVDGFL
jgi:hypothetical protein